MPVHNLTGFEMLIAKLSMVDAELPLRRQQRRVAISMGNDAAEFRPMELPQMGTSDYVCRTVTLRAVNGALIFSTKKILTISNLDAPG